MGVVLEFLDDAEAFLAAAHDRLTSEPVASTVVATVAAQTRRDGVHGGRPVDGFPVWWLVVRDGDGSVVGAAMRTAPFAPHPPYLLPMPATAARELARTLHARGEVVRRAHGALPATEAFAAETARLLGGTSRVAERSRLFELGTLVEPAAPAGRPRFAREEEADLVLEWYQAFLHDAAEQAGRTEPQSDAAEDQESMARRIRDRTVWVWEDTTGTAVHVTGATRPVFGVARIGPVYTPRELRGRGYAGATVAAVSRARLDEGARVCLFTDQANPVSNALYERLGFRPVVDMANLVVD